MIDRIPLPRRETNAQSDTDGNLQWALRIASAVRHRWRSGAAPNLPSVLASHPGLKNHRTIVLELAYEEYCIRLKTGESLDADAFSRRFPSLERSLCFFIAVHSILGNDPDYVKFQSTVAWPEPGSHFLGFDLTSEIGRGAIGRVFLASERALGSRRVALKVALQNGHEAEILGRLRHANIVPIYSIQEDAATGLTAFCMPYLGQATLAAVLDEVHAGHRPPMRARAILDAVRAANQGADAPDSPPPDRILGSGSYVEAVIHLAVQLAEALAHAHAHGIFHRDLKPSNILMSPEGRPLLLDFNLSVDERYPSWRIGGTLPYMAPEELSALCDPSACPRRFDPRSDLFSLGVILYELLTGHLPFGAIPCDRPLKETAAWLRKRQAEGPTPIRQYNRQVDTRLSRLIGSCLAIDPDLRPQNADALAAALRNELTLFRRTARWAAAHRRSVLAAAFAAVLLLLAAAAFFVLRPPYSVRQFRQGLVYYQAGQDELALDCLNASLRADPRNGGALIGRARVFQHKEDFRLAFADYEAADRLAPSPWIDACQGYCLSRLAQDEQAVACYRRAMQGGNESAAVLNNLGYSWLQLHQFEAAEACLRRALEADGALQAPHHNLVLLFLQRGLEGKAIPPEAFVHARRALETGPQSGKLCLDLASLHALAAGRDTALATAAIGYVAQAVAQGINPEIFRSDPVFAGLRQDPAFQEALSTRGAAQKTPVAVQVIDPWNGRQ